MKDQNPLVNEGLMLKIKKGVSKKEYTPDNSGRVECHLIGMNDAIPICAEAASCCWDKPIPDDFAGKADYVGKRSKTGHTSILEHSNIVMYLKVDNAFEDELMTFIGSVRYLTTKVFRIRNAHIHDGWHWHMIIGGSYRGYSDLYREADDLNNPVLKAITGCLYTYGHSAAFEDIIELKLLDGSLFMNIEPDENFKLLNSINDGDYNVYLKRFEEEHPEQAKIPAIETDLYKVIGLDSLNLLYTNIYNIDPNVASMISTYDLIKFATITILFKNMSRTCTHQLVRHRNAITQESQRYVDYSEACFNSPEIFKPDRYDKDHKYRVRFAGSAPMNLTLSEIGKAMCDIYGMLHNPAVAGAEHHLLKEDARAFLPSNVQCKKIYITFTLKNFLKFLNLREDKHAQAEIRQYATSLGDWFRWVTKFNTKELCDLYTLPRLLIEEPFPLSAIEEEVVETVEITEDDYMRAAGLDKEEETDNSEE